LEMAAGRERKVQGGEQNSKIIYIIEFNLKVKTDFVFLFNVKCGLGFNRR